MTTVDIVAICVVAAILVGIGIWYTVKFRRRARSSLNTALMATMISATQNVVYVRLLRAICMELAEFTLAHRRDLSDKDINLLTQLAVFKDGISLLDMLEELRSLNGKRDIVHPDDVDLEPEIMEFLRAARSAQSSDGEDQ